MLSFLQRTTTIFTSGFCSVCLHESLGKKCLTFLEKHGKLNVMLRIFFDSITCLLEERRKGKMASSSNFTVAPNTWVGLVNWHIDDVPDKKLAMADISWFNAMVSRVISQSEDMIEVQLHFGPNDSDNKKYWKLFKDDLLKNTSTAQPFNLTADIIEKNAGKSQFAWRRYASNPNRVTEYIRSLTNDEIIGILQYGFPLAFAKLANLDLAETWQLVAILNNPTKTQSIPAAYKKPVTGVGAVTGAAVAPKTTKRRGDGETPEEAETHPAKEPRLLNNVVSSHEFNLYKREMNNRLSNIEQMINRFGRSVQGLTQNRAQAAQNVQVAVRNVFQHRKAELFDQIKLIREIPTGTEVYNKMWPHVRDGGVTFSGIANIARCLRYMHTSEDKVLCESSDCDKVVNDQKYYYHTVSAKKVPLAIMEVDKSLKQFVRNTRIILPLKKAYSIWNLYRTCDKCVAKLTGLHFVEEMGGFRKGNKTPNPVWEMCSICFIKRSNKKRFGDICPACDTCLLNNNKNGNANGGDDRSYAIMPVFYRFPWLTCHTNEDKKYAHLFTATNTVGGNQTDPNLRGPDAVFFVHVPEVNKKVWILTEEDGDQHNNASYTTEGEIARVNRIRHTLLNTDNDNDRGDHVLLIRYPPLGVSKSVSGLEYNLDKGIRLIIVRMWVCWFLKQVISDNPLSKTTVLYLFYNFDNRHLKRAFEEVKPGDFSVGFAYTFPQETHTAETENDPELFDWRYCVHPEEGVLVNELARKHNLLFVKTKDVFQ